jgi:hypothetical protein
MSWLAEEQVAIQEGLSPNKLFLSSSFCVVVMFAQLFTRWERPERDVERHLSRNKDTFVLFSVIGTEARRRANYREERRNRSPLSLRGS